MANEKRLIDRNEIFPNGTFFANAEDPMKSLDELIERIWSIPTVDAVEVVHGRWEWYTDRCEDLFLGCDDDYGWRCSKCKVPLDDEDDPEVMPTFRYCPNCGAKMRGSEV